MPGQRRCRDRRRVEAVADARDGDPSLQVVQVVGHDEVVGDGVGPPERAEGLFGNEIGHRVS
jgi:hypothetical protein